MSRGSSRKFSRCSVARAVTGDRRRQRAQARDAALDASRSASTPRIAAIERLGRGDRATRSRGEVTRATRPRMRSSSTPLVCRCSVDAAGAEHAAASNTSGRSSGSPPENSDHARAERGQRLRDARDLVAASDRRRRCASTSRTTRSGCCSGWSERTPAPAGRTCGSSARPSADEVAVVRARHAYCGCSCSAAAAACGVEQRDRAPACGRTGRAAQRGRAAPQRRRSSGSLHRAAQAP